MLRPEQLEVNETVTPMDTAGIWRYNSRVSKFSVEFFSSASPPRAKTGMKRKMEAEPSNPRKDRRMSDQ